MGKFLLKCAVPDMVDFVGDLFIDTTMEKFNCVVIVFEGATNGTGYASAWSQYHQKINQTVHKYENCKHSNGVAKAK